MMGDCAVSLLLDSTQGISALTSLSGVLLRPGLRHNYAITKVNAGVSGQIFVYLLKIALYLYEYVTT